MASLLLTDVLGGTELPVSVIARITTYISDLRDLAHLARSSRLLYYVALPRLYQHVDLRLRSASEQIEAYKDSSSLVSAFCAALDALSTGQSARLVREATVRGTVPATNDHLHGRLSDFAVLLSIAIRAAIDQMTVLHKFTWMLDAKPLQMLYQGLEIRSSLTHFTLVFPTSREPRPLTTIPGIPSLLTFRVMNMDPLCYNDDISLLLLNSKKLEALHMHWNPRMRLEAECSAHLNSYFHRCVSAGYMFAALREVRMQNFYGPNQGQLYAVLPQSTIIRTHFLDMFGAGPSAQSNVFVNASWASIPPILKFNWKIHRCNEMSMQHTRMLRGFKGIEELYFPSKTVGLGSPATSMAIDNDGTPSSGMSSSTASSAVSLENPVIFPGSDVITLGNEYLDAVCKNHGPTLRKCLFVNAFGYTSSQIGEIAKACPDLEQFGVALKAGGENPYRTLIFRFPKLRALRVLDNQFLAETVSSQADGAFGLCEMLRGHLDDAQSWNLRWLGFGKHVFYISRENGRHTLTASSLEDVQHEEIWGMDNLEL